MCTEPTGIPNPLPSPQWSEEEARRLQAFFEDSTICHAGRDGDCTWSGCPQLRDGEPKATGRNCPFWQAGGK